MLDIGDESILAIPGDTERSNTDRVVERQGLLRVAGAVEHIEAS